MILRDVRQNTRRQFLWHAAWLVPAVGALRLSAEEPFDSLPASVWKNARNNGLVMIHRPAPSELSWQTQIVKNGEPGEPLIVAGRVSAPDGPTPAEGVTIYAYNTDAEGYLRRKPHGVSAADLWLDEDECRGGL